MKAPRTYTTFCQAGHIVFGNQQVCPYCHSTSFHMIEGWPWVSDNLVPKEPLRTEVMLVPTVNGISKAHVNIYDISAITKWGNKQHLSSIKKCITFKKRIN